ncbi:hypothetical protein [Desulfosarcina widdelii]|uniref:hypothetical protein n=1 Tax=Desulfosarcina widdelii TaxID=947919 RepID=UPI0012D33512|nr:hypothetical protein [Desulfosarcina widdelii]
MDRNKTLPVRCGQFTPPTANGSAIPGIRPAITALQTRKTVEVGDDKAVFRELAGFQIFHDW